MCPVGKNIIDVLRNYYKPAHRVVVEQLEAGPPVYKTTSSCSHVPLILIVPRVMDEVRNPVVHQPGLKIHWNGFQLLVFIKSLLNTSEV